MKRAVGVSLLPFLLAGCDAGHEQTRQIVYSPNRQFVAVYSYWMAGPMVSDNARVRIYLVQDGKFIKPCSAYEGEYGRISGLHWPNENQVGFNYDRGHLSAILTQCAFDDHSVEVVPHPILPQKK